jgi:carboxyl-terminal processing protease
MRRTAIALGWLLCPAALLAAPAPTGRTSAPAPAGQAQVEAAAREYALNLWQVVATVDGGYVRPVNRADLIEAGLVALYEAAQVPVPASLKTAIKKADKDDPPAPVVRPTGGRYGPPFNPNAPLYSLVATTRAGLGNPEALQGRKALLVSCRAMMRTLDPFCAVVTAEEANTLTGFDQTAGLGIDLVERAGAGPLVIKAAVPGGPAQRAGLQAGDRILRIGDTDAATLPTDEALRRLNGGAAVHSGDALMPLPPLPRGGGPADDSGGTTAPVCLTVRSGGAREDRKVTLQPESFQPETVQGVVRTQDNGWDFWLERKKRIAQVRIIFLAKEGLTAAELARVLTRLENDGLAGLILDLRWCPGGYLASATATAELFIKDGKIATTEMRGEERREYTAEGSPFPKFLRFPMVVLVNGETTGGGELIAAALQDHMRAAVAGQRTRGKGTIQQPEYVTLFGEGGRIDGQLQLKLTRGTFRRPNGRGLTRFADSKPSDDWGVRPDPGLEFHVSTDLTRQLKEWWGQQSARPAASSQALPLDDPEQDPQRQAALKALLRIVADKK